MKKALVLASLFFATNAFADGLLRTTDLKKYCNQEGIDRQTIIYLDQGIIAKKDPNWYKDIINKTKFLPGERLQVVTINDGGATVELAWDTCFPKYTSSAYKKLKSKEGFGSVFTGGIDDQLKADKKSFEKKLYQALGHPLANSRHEQPPIYQSGSFPTKKLVEAFYYDAGRFDLKDGISRVIVFSDMIEKSDLVSHTSLESEVTAKQVAKRFPMFLSHSSFYIYGINYTNKDTALNEKMESFWRQYFLKSGAHIVNYSTQLVLPKKDDGFKARSYSGALVQSDGKKLSTNLRLATQPDGRLVHSWLTIGDHYMTLEGNMNCSGQNCTVDAKITGSTFDGFKVSDVLKLTGNHKSFSGKVGARDESVIDDEGKIYRFDVKYSLDKNLSI